MSERLCLGRIKSVESYHLNISLLHGVKGRVQIAHISLPYREALDQFLEGDKNVNVATLNEMFAVGQVVRCSPQAGETITNDAVKSKTKPIALSLNPAHVNRNLRKTLMKPYVVFTGAVKSIEDHGYVVDTGVSGLYVFLPFEETPLPKHEKYTIGYLVELAIMDEQSSNVSRVLRGSMLKRQIVPDSDDVSFDSLLPGMHIPVKVTSTGLDGLDCSFRSFNIHIPAQHCPQEVERYSIGSRFAVCITDINLITKNFTASLLPHFVKYGLKESEDLMSFKHVKIGTLVEDAILKRRYRNSVYLWLPAFKCCGILPKSNVFTKNAPKKWTSQFPKDTPVRCRIIDFDLFLNAPVVSCKKSVLESQFITLDDVQVGAKVSVTIRKFIPRGISVRLAGHIRGIIPYLHLADVAVKNPQDIFKIKNKIQVMVLGINRKRGELQLTAKKSLISSVFPILGSSSMLRSWEENEVEKRTINSSEPFIVTAFVIQAGVKGILVCGLNDVRGWLPRSQISIDYSQSFETFFSKGLTLQLRVLKRLQVSLRREKPSTQFLLSQYLCPENARPFPAINTSVRLGELYFCRVIQIGSAGLQVTLLKNPNSTDMIDPAFLPFTHLSDSLSITTLARRFRSTCFHSMSLLSLTDDSETPTPVVVVGLGGNEGIVVSAKPSLISAAEASADSFGAGFLRNPEQLVVGSQWVGWVANHKDYGLFVEFPGRLRGLVPTRYLCDRKAPEGTDWSALLPPGTSVEAKVVEVNGTRFLLSLRMIDTYTSAEEQYVKLAVARAGQFFKECRWICKYVKHLSHLAQFTPGQVVKFHVDGITDEVVTGWVDLPSSASENGRISAAALLLNTYEVGCTLGGTYEAVVTLPNVDAGKLEVALLPWLLKSIKQRREGQFGSTAMQVRNGQTISSIVVSLGNTRDIVVVALKQHALGHLAVLPARRCFNDIVGANAWALGQINRVTIRSEIVSESKRERSFYATLSIYDPHLSKAPRKVGSHEESIPLSTLEFLTVPGTRLPEVIFIGLRRTSALFRLPNTRGCRALGARLICSLVDLAPTSGKAIRKFLAELPEPGTVFQNAVVLNAPEPTLSHDGRGRTRLPLSSRVARISFIEKEPDVGDLVSAMFLGVHGASWRLLLPNNTQGLLHVSCMTKSLKTAEAESEHSQFPTHPARGVWLTCRIIDQAVNIIDENKAPGEVDEKSMKANQNEVVSQLAKGDEVISIGDYVDEVPGMPRKIFYVSTDASDIRKWNPEKYKGLELTLNQSMVGIIKRWSKKALIVSLDYKTDVVIPYSIHLRRNQKLGSPIKVVLTSLNPLRGRLAEPSRRRQRSLSASVASEGSEGPTIPKKRRRQASLGLESAPTIGNMRSRYAAFLSPLQPEEIINESQHSKLKDNEDVEMVNESVEDAQPNSVFYSSANEVRLAEIAKATSAIASGAQIPRMSSVEEFEVAVRNASQNARLWSLYAAHYQAAGDIGRARAILRRALASPVANSTASEDFVNSLLISFLRLESAVVIGGGSDEAIKNLEEIIHRIEQIGKGGLVKKALALLSTIGLHEQADAMAKKFVKNHASLPEAWLNLIRVRFRAGNVTGAREAQRNAGLTLRLSQLPQFAMGCARLECEFGDFERAIKLFEEQIAAHPRRKVLYTTCIQLLLSAGKEHYAESVRQKALNNLPEKEYASINKFFCL